MVTGAPDPSFPRNEPPLLAKRSLQLTPPDPAWNVIGPALPPWPSPAAKPPPEAPKPLGRLIAPVALRLIAPPFPPLAFPVPTCCMLVRPPPRPPCDSMEPPIPLVSLVAISPAVADILIAPPLPPFESVLISLLPPDASRKVSRF